MMQTSQAGSLATVGHNPLLAAFTAQQAAAHHAITHGSTPSASLAQLHPAFLHPFYPIHPSFAPLRPMLAASAAVAQNAAEDRNQPIPGKSFTIDAILGKEGKLASAGGVSSRHAAGSLSPRSAGVSVEDRAGSLSAGIIHGSSKDFGRSVAPGSLGVLQHRQHRLQSTGHPYLSSLANCTTPLSFRSAFTNARGK